MADLRIEDDESRSWMLYDKSVRTGRPGGTDSVTWCETGTFVAAPVTAGKPGAIMHAVSETRRERYVGVL